MHTADEFKIKWKTSTVFIFTKKRDLYITCYSMNLLENLVEQIGVQKMKIIDLLNSMSVRMKATKSIERLLSIYLMVFFSLIAGVGITFLLTREVLKTLGAGPCADVLLPPGGVITTTVDLYASNFTNGVIDCSERDIVIGSTGKVIAHPYIAPGTDHTFDYGVTILAANFTIDSGGVLDISGDGEGGGYGAGQGKDTGGVGGDSLGNAGGSGAGHGGGGGSGQDDGTNNPGAPGNSYGDKFTPVTLGSGGGKNISNNALGGSGGGSIKLELTGTFNLNGEVKASGQNGQVVFPTGGGGGAGGSVWIEAASFEGSGVVNSNGGNGGYSLDINGHVDGFAGGGGGGGLIRMICTDSNSFSGSVNYNGGLGGPVDFPNEGGSDGQQGLVVGPTCYPNEPINLQQYTSDGTTVIPAGAKTKETTVVFKFDVSDVDYPSVLIPQIEVRNNGESFTGIPTNNGSSINYNGGVPVRASVIVQNLTKSVPYHWQARVVDDNGVASDWISYDLSPAEDFIVLGNPYKIIYISGDGQSGEVGSVLANPFIIQIQDISGYTYPGANFSWTVNAGGGGIQECSGCTNYSASTDADGLSSVTLKLGTTAGTSNNIVLAVRSGLVGNPIQFTASAFPGPITHYDISVPSFALINQSFSPSVQVSAKDQYENLVSGSNDIFFEAVDPNTYQPFVDGNLSPDSVALVDGQVSINNMQYDTMRNIRVRVRDNVDPIDYNESISSIVTVVDAIGDCFGRPNVPGTLSIDQSEIHNAVDYPGGIINCSEVDVEVLQGTSQTVITLNGYQDGDDQYPSGDYGIILYANSLLIGSGAKLNLKGTGYPGNMGLGKGNIAGGYWPAAGGGGYGGYGGTGQNGPGSSGIPSGGVVNGDVFEPNYLGSGGGKTSGGYGGGAIKIVIDGKNGTNPNSDKLIVNGEIDADGGDVTGNMNTSGGGSGGSIWLLTDNLEGSGLIHANGGFGGDGGIAGYGGGGGGGRIALEYGNKANFVGSVYAQGGGNGTGYNNFIGGPGTVYFEQVGTQNDKQGDLYVDNNNHNYKHAGIIESSCQEQESPSHGGCKFNKITLGIDMNNDGAKGYGHLDILGTGSALTLLSSTLTGDGTSDLSPYGITYIAENPYTISLAGLHIRGDIAGYSNPYNNWIENLDGLITNEGEIALYANTPWRTGSYTFNSLTVDSPIIPVTPVDPRPTLTLVSYDSGNYTAPDPWGDDYGVSLNLVNMEVKDGGEVTATGKGYPFSKGPGSSLGDGAGHGGYGGNNATVYDSVYEPIQLGSGGGAGTGEGGGAFKLVLTGELIINGNITSNGIQSGSGGSIWIDANILSGGVFGVNGKVYANGGSSTGVDGGGGGRISIYYYNKVNFDGVVYSYGGGYGGPGTIYWEQKGSPLPGDPITNPYSYDGLLFVDNNNVNFKHAGIIEGNCLEASPPRYGCRFSKITLGSDLDGNGVAGYGHLDFLGTNSKVTLTTTDALTGDGTSKMNVYGLMNFNFDPPESAVLIELVDIGIYGDISGVDNLTLGNDGRLTLRGWTQRRSERMINPINEYTFGDVIINNTGILKLMGYDDLDTDFSTSDDYGVSLTLDNLSINPGGLVSADGGGYGAAGSNSSKRGPGGGSNCIEWATCHGGAGTYGGYGEYNNSKEVYGDPYEPTWLGSAGGCREAPMTAVCDEIGGLGGGAVHLDVLNLLSVDGELSANSDRYSILYPEIDDWEAGSGGSIWIDTKDISGTGYIKANGRTEISNGSGGRIAVYYESNEGFNLNVDEQADNNHLQTYGNNGGPGTIYIEQKQKGSTPSYNGSLLVNNNNVNGRQAGLIEDDYQFENITLTEYGYLDVIGLNSSVTLTSSSSLSGDGTSIIKPYGLLNLPNYTVFEGVTANVVGDISGASNLLTLQNQGRLILNAWTQRRSSFGVTPVNEFQFGDVVVNNTGELKLMGYDDLDTDFTVEDDFGITLNVNNLTINTGGKVDADGGGYGYGGYTTSNRGPGGGENCTDWGECHGGAGTYGGYGQNNNLKEIYGSLYEPQWLGSSGGGYHNQSGGAYKFGGLGGGAMNINVEELLIVDGQLSSNGEKYSIIYPGIEDFESGSGGSLWIDTRTIGGSGLIQSNGGTEQSDGSGGRIALYYENSLDFNLIIDENLGNDHLQAYGNNGGPGTIYIEQKQKNVSPTYQGKLYVNNGGIDGREAGAIEANYQFESIKLTEYGDLNITGTNSTLTLMNGDVLSGDLSPTLKCFGLIVFPSIFNLESASLDVSGDFSGAQDLSVTNNGELILNAHTARRAELNILPINEYTFNTINIGENSVVRLMGYDNGDELYNVVDDFGLVMNITEELVINSDGVLTADSGGFEAGRGLGKGGIGSGMFYPGRGGGGYGGYGGRGAPGPGGGDGIPGLTYGDIYNPLDLGSGGAQGGRGGGAIKINAVNGVIHNNGKITSNGEGYAYSFYGGGSGGSLWIIADLLDGSGEISADGGSIESGAWYNWGGGGGGGRVSVQFNQNNYAGQIHAFGEFGGYSEYAGPGTVYLEDLDSGMYGDLMIDNGARSPSGYSTAFDPVNTPTYYFNNVFINANVKVLSDRINDLGVVLNLTGEFLLEENSLMDGIGQGWSGASGEGKGQDSSSILCGGGGGGHQGDGGDAQCEVPGPPIPQGGDDQNTNVILPGDLGSGGGSGGLEGTNKTIGGSGGGALQIFVAGEATINGIIDMSGEDGLIGSPGSGGGSGGSIFISADCVNIATNGTFNVIGGDGGIESPHSGGGGGGGNVSIWHNDCLNNYNTNPPYYGFNYQGGSGAQEGGEGYYSEAMMPFFPMPGGLEQYKLDEITKIPVGSWTDESSVSLRVNATDPDGEAGDMITVEYEVVPATGNFDNVADYFQTTLYQGAGTPVYITTDKLTWGESYKWQARIIDADGVISLWTEFDPYYNQSKNDPDFIIQAVYEITLEKGTVELGEPIYFTVDVHAGTVSGVILGEYRGTIHFSSTDNSAVLPANYTFTDIDNGSHTFPVVTFNTPGTQTLTGTDTSYSSITGSANVLVLEEGGNVCGDSDCQGAETCEHDQTMNPESDYACIDIHLYINIGNACREPGTPYECTYCGDSTCQPLETCEQGSGSLPDFECPGYPALASPDGCRTWEEANQCTFCGDGLVQTGEQCDGGDGGLTCQDFGFDGGTLACDGSCNYDTNDCFRCGDNICNIGETCEYAGESDFSCLLGDGDLGGSCRVPNNSGTDGIECSFCGDGMINTDAGELCDPNALQGDPGWMCSEDEICNSNCSCTTVIDEDCGSGVCNGNKTCEHGVPDFNCLFGNLIDQACRDYEDPDSCTYCGDRLCQEGETCESNGSEFVDCSTGNPLSQECRDYSSGVINECSYCGDDELNIGEQCDPIGSSGECLFGDCASSCLCPAGPECGDGGIDTGEECDPPGSSGQCSGNSICQDNCTCPAPITCGNGLLDPDEQCDPPGSEGQCTYGVCGGNCLCSTPPTCGNGTIDQGEQCDSPGELGECEYGACLGNCLCPAPPTCGNNIIDPGEACDPPSSVCAYGETCSFQCQCPDSGIVCGNNVCEGGESCEYTGEIQYNCTDNQNLDGSCRQAGQMNQCTYCGDGVLQAGEQCELGQTLTLDCINFDHFIGGNLSCSNTCMYDTTSCIGQSIGALPETGNIDDKVRAYIINWSMTTTSLLLGITSLIFAIPALLLKKQKNVWGVVFDLKNRKPVAFAIVRLYNPGGYIVVEQKVTDIEGRYGFAVNKGKYMLEIVHNSYKTYNREIEVKGDEDSFTENIGLERQKDNNIFRNLWFSFKGNLKENLPRLSVVLYSIGLVLTIIIFAVSQMIYNLLVLILYVLMAIVYLLIQFKKNWGFIYDSKTGKRISYGAVKLFKASNNKLIDTQMTDKGGRFGFIVDPGEYLLLATVRGYKFPSKKEVRGLRKTFYGSLLDLRIERGGVINLEIPLDPIEVIKGKEDQKLSPKPVQKFESPFRSK